VCSVDKLGLFSIGPTIPRNVDPPFFEASIHSNGNITRALVRNEFGGRRYTFVVTVSVSSAPLGGTEVRILLLLDRIAALRT